jgi:hypothetical protein
MNSKINNSQPKGTSFLTKLPIIILFGTFYIQSAQAQIKIGTNPNKIEKSSLLELESQTEGLLLPRLIDTLAINLLNPPSGMLIYLTKPPRIGLYVRKPTGWDFLNGSLNGINSVDTDKIRDGAVTTPKLADGSVTDAKVAAGINKSKVGLSNVDNTSDAVKPISTATQTALELKENLGNKSTATTLGTSDVLYPTQNAVKTYVDGQFAAGGITDATTLAKGKIQLAGDLTGTAALPAIAASAVTTTKIADANVTADKLAADAVTTIKLANGAVTLSKQADIATASLLGRNTAGTGAPEVLSAATAKTLLGLTKTDVSLGNVDNTSDASKPVSTLTQTALDLKAPLLSPALTGVPTAPTADALTSTTQVATTAFVTAATAAGTVDADGTTKGKIQLAGDLSGIASAPTIAANAVTSAKIADGTIVEADLANGTVTLAKQANIATASLIGRSTAGAGAPEALTATAAKTLLSLENVSNTADADKPVSSAAQTALNLKAPLANPTFTGSVTAPTFTGALTGNATSATTSTNLAAGQGGQIPYQSATGTTAMLANGTAGQVLQSNGTTLAPSWVAAGTGNMVLADAQTVTGAKTFGAAGNVGKLIIAGNTSGTTILNANATASGTVTLPTGGILATLDGTETLTNKTLTSPTLTGAVSVNGAATNTTAYNAATSSTIDFTKSNLAYTTNNPGAFTLSGIKDGGTYTFAVQGTISGTSSFAATDFTFLSGNNGPSTAGKQTLYTFIVMGTTVYYFMAIGF